MQVANNEALINLNHSEFISSAQLRSIQNELRSASLPLEKRSASTSYTEKRYSELVKKELDAYEKLAENKKSQLHRRQAGGLPPLPPTALERSNGKQGSGHGITSPDAEDEEFVLPLTRSTPRIDHQTQRNPPAETGKPEPNALPLCKPWKPRAIPFSKPQEYWVIGCVDTKAGLQCEPNGAFTPKPSCRMPEEYNNACSWTESWLMAKITHPTQGMLRVKIVGCASISINAVDGKNKIVENESFKCGNNDSLELSDAVAIPANPCFVALKAAEDEVKKDEKLPTPESDNGDKDRAEAGSSKASNEHTHASAAAHMKTTIMNTIGIAAAIGFAAASLLY